MERVGLGGYDKGDTLSPRQGEGRPKGVSEGVREKINYISGDLFHLSPDSNPQGGP